MLIFVDESGDTGMSGKEGQSKYFVVTLVRFENDDEGERVDARIDRLRSELGLNPRFEFRFHETKSAIRQRFLKAMVPLDWGFLAFVMNKRGLWSPSFRSSETLYKHTAQYVFENARPYLNEAKVVIDKTGSARFRRELSRHLKSLLNPGRGQPQKIKKIKPAISARNNLVQLADMVCGSIYRSMLVDKKDRLLYRAIIEGKAIEPVRVWP
jgi:hypothetical protein